MLRLSTLALFTVAALAGPVQAQKFLSVTGENTRMTIGAMATAEEEAATAEGVALEEGEDVAVVEEDEDEIYLIPQEGDPGFDENADF